MALMTWNGNKYSVGVEEVDNQHKTLMNILNEFHAATLKGKAKEIAATLIPRLIALAKEHFSAEEKLMESIHFSGLNAHRAKHLELAAKIAEFAVRHEKGDPTVYLEALYFVRDWQHQHMQVEDQEYAAWLKSHPARQLVA
ncbi:MAG: bacteriohemerythrin [Terracidiphilus sp.]